MRTTLITAALLSVLLANTARAETITASVNGMVCAFCATGIEKTFKALPDVERVKVDLDTKLVTISTKEGRTMDDKTITGLIADAGYTVTKIERKK